MFDFFKAPSPSSNAPSAAQLIKGLPERFQPHKSDGWKATIHFLLEGDGGGTFTVHVNEAQVDVLDGIHGKADLELITKAATYVAIEMGDQNPQMAFMMGMIKVSDMGQLMNVSRCFKRYFEMKA